MNRIVLALLALFAGIAAQVSPAEARVRGETEIGATLVQKVGTRTAQAVQTPPVKAVSSEESGVFEPVSDDDAPVWSLAPAVVLRADRARE